LPRPTVGRGHDGSLFFEEVCLLSVATADAEHALARHRCSDDLDHAAHAVMVQPGNERIAVVHPARGRGVAVFSLVIFDLPPLLFFHRCPVIENCVTE
jgi:hypothetical protein